jgi:VWFA-related protein
MRRVLAFCLAAFLLAPLACPQEPAGGGSIIRSESRLVLVDTVVTDRKGNYVRDLTQKDFRVFEDNKEQSITAFSLETGTTPDESRKHYIVLFFDDTTGAATQAFARQAAAKFIESNAGPDRLMATAEYSGTLRVTQNFTADADKLKQAVAGLRFSTAPPVQAANTGRRGRGGPQPDNYAVRGLLAAVRSLVQGISGLPGRKTLVFISSGFPGSQDTLADVSATVEASNRANVGIYPIASSLAQTAVGDDSAGAETAAPARPARRGGGGAGSGDLSQFDNSPTGAQQVLNTLATGTGGFSIVNSNDLFSGFEKIGREQEAYYMLGFVPAKDAQPGACHSLKVRVAKSGDQVRSRASYCEAKSLDVLSGTPAERDLEGRIAANAASTVTGASLAAPFFYTAANTARVHVVLEVPAGTMHFVKDKGKYRSTMNVVGLASLADGTVRGRFSDNVKVAFDDKKEVDAFSAKPFLYEKQFPIGPGNYTFRLVFSTAANQLGRLEMPITIEPWDPKQFALSGVALSRSAHAAKETITGLDVELTDDRKPLVANGVELIPTGSNQFGKSAKTYLYAEIYEPALAMPDVKEKDVPAVGVHMELLEQGSGKLKKDFGVLRLQVPAPSGNPAVPMGLILSAPEVEAGAYTVRLTALDAMGHEAVRTIEVRLEN